MLDEVKGIREELQAINNMSNDFSLATELLEDARRFNKRTFVMWVITFVSFLALLGYTIYLLNDIGTSTESIEIDGVEHIDNSHIKIGDDIWEKLE